MRVLVTGATGFIGSRLVQLLAQSGHEAIAVVRNPDRLIAGCQNVVWDLGETRRPIPAASEIDAVVHAAQSRNYRAFPADAEDMFRVNVHGAWSLLDYAAELGVRRVCLLSSGSVYEPYSGDLHEEAVLAPASFLGASKLAAEELARPYRSIMKVSVLRLFCPFGPGQRDRIVPDIIERVRVGRPVQLCRNGEGLRIAPTYVDDLADVILSAVTQAWAETINVASPASVTLRQLAEMIGDLLGKRPVFETTDRESISIVPVLDRLRQRFDPARFTALNEALRKTIADTAV